MTIRKLAFGSKSSPTSYNLRELGKTKINYLSGWKREYEIQRYASIPNVFVRNQKVTLEDKKRLLGPGTYNITNNDLSNNLYGPIDTHECRFRELRSICTPGPGTYGFKGDPYLFKEMMAFKRRYISNKETLGCGKKDLRSLVSKKCSVPPGVYNISSSIDNILKKQTGKRGPYDITTAPRKFVVVSNNSVYPDPGTYNISSFTNDLTKPEKRYTGKFQRLKNENLRLLKISALKDKNVNNESLYKTSAFFNKIDIGFYDQIKLNKNTSFNKNPPPFLTCANRGSIVNSCIVKNPVGPGRYNLDNDHYMRCIWGAMSSFDSKTKFGLDVKNNNILRERLRPINIPPSRKILVCH